MSNDNITKGLYLTCIQVIHPIKQPLPKAQKPMESHPQKTETSNVKYHHIKERIVTTQDKVTVEGHTQIITIFPSCTTP